MEFSPLQNTDICRELARRIAEATGLNAYLDDAWGGDPAVTVVLRKSNDSFDGEDKANYPYYVTFSTSESGEPDGYWLGGIYDDFPGSKGEEGTPVYSRIRNDSVDTDRLYQWMLGSVEGLRDDK